MSRRWKVVLGVTLAIVLTYLFLRSADLGQVWQEITSAHLGWVAAATLVTLFTMLQRAWRWQSLLAPIAAVRMTLLLACTFMGWAVTVLLPGRLGEVVRPVLASRRSDVAAGAAIGSVVLERAFDALTVLLILGAYLALLPPPAGLDHEGRGILAALRTTGVLGLAGGGVALGIGMLLLRDPERSGRVFNRLLAWLPDRVVATLRSFVFGLASLGSPRRVGVILLHSITLWVVLCSTHWMMLRALRVDVPWYAVPPLVALLVVGVMVPTPGAVGSYHKAAQIGLATLWGVDNELAVAFAILSHAVGFLPTAGIGLVLLVREGIGWGSLQRLRGRAEEPGSPAAL